MKVCYDNRDIEMVSEYIDKHDGDGLLIIFDGWDELSMEHRELSSLAVRFIRREILLKCTVIATSRSYASESIMRLNGNYRHFEVIGFGKEVYKVIQKTLLDDSQLASELIRELESQTNIKSLCYIPLVCSMVILLYKKSQHLPSRLTELYELFVLHAVKRHVKKSSTISTDPKRIRLLNQLPPCITASFNKLCHFAYLSLKENNPKMTFSLPELEEALDVSVAEGYIGLMTTVSVYDLELYQFPHLTIQEFLAAWWIANNDGMDVKAFEEHFEDDHFRMCLRFVAGLTGLKNEMFKETKFFNIQLYLGCRRDDHLYSSIDIRSCDHMISTDIPQRQLHLLYESNNTDLCKHMANTFIDNSFCLQRFCEDPDSFDVICVLFFLHSSDITWNMIHLWIDDSSPLPGLIMSDNSTDAIECMELIIECGDVIRPTHNFNEPKFLDKVVHLFSSDNIHCKRDEIDCLNKTALIALLGKPQMKTIYISFNIDQDELSRNVDESFLVTKKLLETTMTLEGLEVEITADSYEIMAIFTLAVIDGVMRNKSIKSLKINASCFSESDEKDTFDYSDVSRRFKQLLKNNMTLEEIKFDIEGLHLPYDIPEINAPLQSLDCSWLKPTEIESVLARCQHLQSLTIDGDHFSNQIQIPIMKLLDHLPKLSELIVYPLHDCGLCVELFTILQTNQTLEELSLHDESDITNDEVLLSLKNCLIKNKSIKDLDIAISVSDLNFLLALTEGLSSNKTIEQLSLSIDITADEGRSLLYTVFKMKSLISLELTLGMDGVDPDLYPMLTSLLHQNSHIQELYINTWSASVHITHSKLEYHFEELIKTVYNHQTLEYIHLELQIKGAVGVQSHFKRIAEQYIYMKQISNCISKIPPLIELFII